ncbi:MAG: hypothetical protein KGO94_09570 [Alphaproteobacteria bacterium]|nr:hypothetical protein [Alphaproteobacteria bacterium]
MTFTRSLAFITPFALALSFMANHAQSYAGVVEAQEATKLLARSVAVTEKCKFLNANQKEELSRFMAKAEIAMVAKTSTAQTKALMATGRMQGNAALCSEQERLQTVDIISAAREAIAVGTQTSAPASPVQAAVDTPKSAIVKPQPEVRMAALTVAPATVRGNLEQYAMMTERYYKARRCNSMSFASISSLYKSVVTTHRLVVKQFGVPAVRAVMQQAETKASATACG